MSKNKEIIGIDVSKSYFDVYSTSLGHKQYLNTPAGIKKFIVEAGNRSHCVMEATGVYHHQLSHLLYLSGLSVSVLNPLVVKRFIQMKQTRNKTDKSDANLICQYGEEQPLDLWEPEPEYVQESKDIYTLIELYTKQLTAFKNKRHSLCVKGKKKLLLGSLDKQIKGLKQEINKLEEELESLIKSNDGELYTHIKSIPGIGSKTAALLIVSTNGFKYFENERQLRSYFGLAPTERSSGSSIRGRSRISKVGNKQVRNHLFLCSFTASKCNPQCKALYERIVNKGKSKKLALIAVANKLLKQSYGIAKTGIKYDPTYKSVLKIN